jgi:hypothetical protein
MEESGYRRTSDWWIKFNQFLVYLMMFYQLHSFNVNVLFTANLKACQYGKKLLRYNLNHSSNIYSKEQRSIADLSGSKF